MSEQKSGNFIAGLVRKEPGSKRPDFTGRLSAPNGEPDHAMALWANKDKNGVTYFAGRIDRMAMGVDAQAQIDSLTQPVVQHDATDMQEGGSNLTVKPYEVILFKNGFKDSDNAKRPDYWGRVNMGDGSPVVTVSMWLKKDRYGNPLLTGATSYYTPAQQRDMPEAPVHAVQEELIPFDAKPKGKKGGERTGR